jgi:transposase
MISLSWEALISRFQVRVLGGSLSFFLQTAVNPESARLVLELHDISLTLTGCLHKKRLVRENVEYFSTRFRN